MATLTSSVSTYFGGRNRDATGSYTSGNGRSIYNSQFTEDEILTGIIQLPTTPTEPETCTFSIDGLADQFYNSDYKIVDDKLYIINTEILEAIRENDKYVVVYNE